MSHIIGIDLGTTNSCIAIADGHNYSIVPNSQGEHTTPSIMAITQNDEILIGSYAKRQMAINHEGTISSVKRLMGSDKVINLRGKEYSPIEVSATILSKLKQDASEFLNEDVSDAIITVPAYFTDMQRQATKEAGRLAGLNVKRIINEPTAAALAFGIDKEESQTVLVYDFGGGTFDISVLQLNDCVFEVLATVGNNMLGGDDFDRDLAHMICTRFEKETGIKIKDDSGEWFRIKEAAEKAKIELSAEETALINIPFITTNENGPIHLEMTIARSEFEELIKPYVDKTLRLMNEAITEAGVSYCDIKHVLLVGGSTKIPYIANQIYKNVGIKASKQVNPDECVAIGAAIQGSIIAGTTDDLLLLDITPLSLGIETHGGLFTRVVNKNTTIPCRSSKLFSTARDNQSEVKIKVYQGERELAKENKLLGDFILSGIVPAPSGFPKIEVTFDIDINGIVNIAAKDKNTGNRETIKISNVTSMTKEEIARVVEDANKNNNSDILKRSAIELKEKGLSVLDYASGFLNESASDSKKIQQLRSAFALLKGMIEIEEPNLDTLKSKINEVENLTSECILDQL